MNDFTRLNLNAKPTGNKPVQDQPSRAVSKRQNMLFAGTLAVVLATGGILLSTNGCSSAPSKNATIQPPEPVSQPMQTAASVTPAPALPSASSEQPAAKAPKKKKAPIVAYANRTYGVSFQYPRKYTLKTGETVQAKTDDLSIAPMQFVEPGGVTVAAVEIPQGFFPNTNFDSAYFNVSVNRSVKEEQCGQFASSKDAPGAVPLGKVLINGATFDEMRGEGEGNASDTTYYHLFENGRCYEIALGMNTVESDGQKVKDVNQTAVFGKLERILSTLKVQSNAAPETPSVTASAGEGSSQ